MLHKFLSVFKPELCTKETEWDGEWLRCKKCGEPLGFHKLVTDDDGKLEVYRFIFPQYRNFIEGSN